MHVNLAAGWIGILLGVFGGMALGMGFHREEWLGGYASLRRRMLRLAHISFFGLALLNLLFWATVRLAGLSGPPLLVASYAFVIGAAAMPACCIAMAWNERLRMLFALPVTSLSVAAALMVWEVVR